MTTVGHALDYQKRLQALEPRVTFLMSLYLHPSITPETILEAKRAGIRGVKSYPAGVTTNSSSGVVDYASFFPVFAEMERQDMILNLHGESPSGGNVTVLNAEETFLPTFLSLHRRFPKLGIVLEHCTTAAAIQAVLSCGPTVAATITAHHLYLIVDDWAGDAFNYCKPVAKTPQDREALLKAAGSGSPKFFLGTDSAPHPAVAKRGGADGKGKHAAGVFTQPYATQLVLEAFEEGVQQGVLGPEVLTPKLLAGFLGEHGRAFYGEPNSREVITVEEEKTETIMDAFSGGKGEFEVVPFRRGRSTNTLRWN